MRKSMVMRPGKSLNGVCEVPGDKSLSHRAALFASIAEGESRIDNFLTAGVTHVMIEGLKKLGVAIALAGNSLTVSGQGLKGITSPEQPIYCGNSATTIRLLSGLAAAAGIPVLLDGSDGLQARPMGRIADPLRLMGVDIVTSKNGTAPLYLWSKGKLHDDQRLKGIQTHLKVASAQVKTCLLLAGLRADSPLTLVEPGPSRDHTERMLVNMGVKVDSTKDTHNGTFTVTLCPPTEPLRPLNMRLPGDISSSAFLIVGGLITPNSNITIKNVLLNPTRIGLIQALREMGGDIQIENMSIVAGEPVGDVHVTSSELKAIEISGECVVRMIDEFPAFASAAAYAEGTSRVFDAVELRHKETDRISVLCQEFRKIGVRILEHVDGFSIAGKSGQIRGEADARGDHRIAMALVIAGAAGDGKVKVVGAEYVEESFPGFAATVKSLGADLEVE